VALPMRPLQSAELGGSSALGHTRVILVSTLVNVTLNPRLAFKAAAGLDRETPRP
jgi:hypothetical protein